MIRHNGRKDVAVKRGDIVVFPYPVGSLTSASTREPSLVRLDYGNGAGVEYVAD